MLIFFFLKKKFPFIYWHKGFCAVKYGKNVLKKNIYTGALPKIIIAKTLDCKLGSKYRNIIIKIACTPKTINEYLPI